MNNVTVCPQNKFKEIPTIPYILYILNLLCKTFETCQKRKFKSRTPVSSKPRPFKSCGFSYVFGDIQLCSNKEKNRGSDKHFLKRAKVSNIQITGIDPFQKWESVKFVPLWCPNFMQNKTSIRWTPRSPIYRSNFVSLSIIFGQKVKKHIKVCLKYA